MPSLTPSRRWQTAFYAAVVWAIASLVVFAATVAGGASPLGLFASKPFWVYPWLLVINPVASAIVSVTLLAYVAPRLAAWLRPRWGAAVAALAVAQATLAWVWLSRVAA